MVGATKSTDYQFFTLLGIAFTKIDNPVLSLSNGFLFGLESALPKKVVLLISSIKQFFQEYFLYFFSAFRRKPGKKPLFRSFTLESSYLARPVDIQLLLPPQYENTVFGEQFFPLVLFNDGQDLEAIQLEQHLHEAYSRKGLPPIITAGIFPKDRMQEYGTAKIPDYKKRGKQAQAYTNFILLELLPYLEAHFRVSKTPENRAFAGFSLGGLSAFDICFKHPKVFGIVGVFSGALWWRSKAFNAKEPDADRIVHTYVEKTGKASKNQRYWFQTGTLDETSDRNNNGIIDAIDDTLDLISLLKKKGIPEKQIRYLEIQEGRHEPKTWSDAMPDFLSWAFAAEK
ncbi:MAG: esterase family protein [Saprospiraceae bacterium]|nr:esterase family protein [Saprospiraceae bacterium]